MSVTLLERGRSKWVELEGARCWTGVMGHTSAWRRHPPCPELGSGGEKHQPGLLISDNHRGLFLII